MSKLGDCTRCEHSHLMNQMGQVMRVCKHGPPTVVLIPAQGGVRLQAVYPPVDENDRCDAFVMTEQKQVING